MKRFAGFSVGLIAVVMTACAGSAMALNKPQPNKPSLTKFAQAKSPSASTDVEGLSEQTLSLANSLASESSFGNYAKPVSKSFSVPLKGQWGVRFDVNQNLNRPSDWNDVDAGAYFKITPSLRVGGSVGFGQKTNGLMPNLAPKKKTQPRVRVETNLKF